MNREKEQPPAAGRFSLFSVACLFLCWVVGTGIAFVAGYRLGKAEQGAARGGVAGVFERPGEGLSGPSLTFDQLLGGAPRDPEGPRDPAPEPAAAPPAATAAAPAPAGPPADGHGSVASAADASAPEPGADGPPGARWVQVASFREAAKARGLALRLREKGYPGHATGPDPDASGRNFYRVVVGPFPSQAEARRRMEDLQTNEGLRGLFLRPGAPPVSDR